MLDEVAESRGAVAIHAVLVATRSPRAAFELEHNRNIRLVKIPRTANLRQMTLETMVRDGAGRAASTSGSVRPSLSRRWPAVRR